MENEKKWESIVEGAEGTYAPITCETRKRHVAILLENTEREALQEAAPTNGTGGVEIVDPILINLVRRTAPNLMAYDLVGVQPMSGPTGAIFAMRSFYGAQPQGPFSRPGDARTGWQTGAATSGSPAVTPAQANQNAGVATNEAFYNEARTAFSGTGTQTSNATAPDYNAYSVGSGMTTAAAERLGGGAGGDGVWGEMSFTIEKSVVEAKSRGLKTSYTNEIAQDLRAIHGLDAETELSNILSTEIVAETNREIVNTIRRVAKIADAEPLYANGVIQTDTAGNIVYGLAGEFDLDTQSDGRWSAEKYKSLLVKINKEANKIAKDTRRGRANFIICSSDVASILDLSGKMVYAPAIDNNLNVDDTGNTFVGVLQGRYRVFIDPYLGYDEIIVGYKGSSEMDAGIFYAPYTPLQMAKAIDPNTLAPVVGFKSRYGMVANPFTTLNSNANNYYRKFVVTGI